MQSELTMEVLLHVLHVGRPHVHSIPLDLKASRPVQIAVQLQIQLLSSLAPAVTYKISCTMQQRSINSKKPRYHHHRCRCCRTSSTACPFCEICKEKHTNSSWPVFAPSVARALLRLERVRPEVQHSSHNHFKMRKTKRSNS